MDENIVKITITENDTHTAHVYEGPKDKAGSFINKYDKENCLMSMQFVHTTFDKKSIRNIIPKQIEVNQNEEEIVEIHIAWVDGASYSGTKGTRKDCLEFLKKNDHEGSTICLETCERRFHNNEEIYKELEK